MRRGPRVLFVAAVAAFGLWTVVQLFFAFRPDHPAADARTLLYEASLFQVEILSGFASEAGKQGTTEQLNGLKQAAYSVEYTHGKLVKALGAGLPELHSVSRLMEWIVRMQIGGERALKPEEKDLLAAIGPLFQQLHESYAGMLTDSGQIVGSKVDSMKHADEEIAKLLSDHVK